jgi:hypothetical protein
MLTALRHLSYTSPLYLLQEQNIHRLTIGKKGIKSIGHTKRLCGIEQKIRRHAEDLCHPLHNGTAGIAELSPFNDPHGIPRNPDCLP